MGKYLMLWEVDESRIPVDSEERKAGWLMMLEMTKQNMSEGLVKDWGAFVSTTNGFSIVDGTEEDIHAMCMKFVPFVRFEIYPAASVDQIVKIVEAM
jgi:hypothetical protein